GSSTCTCTGSTSRWSSIESAALDELGGDDVALDLVGAVTDDLHRCVPEVPLHVEFGGIAVPAVDPHRVEGDLHGGLRREQLRHPGFHVHAAPCVVDRKSV